MHIAIGTSIDKTTAYCSAHQASPYKTIPHLFKVMVTFGSPTCTKMSSLTHSI